MSDAKFQRDYLLTVQSSRDKEQFLSFVPPLTLEFDVKRNILTDTNNGKFTLYNLAKDSRASIYHDRVRIYAPNYQKIELFAGYKSTKKRPLIFLGNVFTANSRKRGTEWITDFECLDGGVGLMTGQIHLTVPSPWTAEYIFKLVAASMNFVQYGAFGDIKIENNRAITLSGSAKVIAARLVGTGLCFVDNGNIFGIQENEYLVKNGQPDLVILPGNIIGSPKRGEGSLEIDMIFEPEAFIGQLADIQSLEPVYNGRYVVRGIHHRGTISEAICGEAMTTLSLYTGGDTLLPVYV